MGKVSTDFRRLTPVEVAQLASAYDRNWQDPTIPRRQWLACTRAEIQRYREGEPQAHFDTLIRALRRTRLINPTVLEVGASSGYYSEVFRIAGFDCHYTGLDYSKAYEELALELYPGIDFRVADARALPYVDKWYDIVISGCCIIHIPEYDTAIAEAARVSDKYVIFARTPVVRGATQFFQKEAYGVRTLEIWFGEQELHSLFNKYSLGLVSDEAIFERPEYSHRTYLLKKQ